MSAKSNLDEILGHGKIRTSAIEYIQEPGTRALVIEGPSGSGKTWLAGQIGTALSDMTALIAVGDAVRRAQDFAPFEGLTRGLSGIENVIVQGGRVVAGTGSFLYGFGTLGATVFDWAVSASKALSLSSFPDFSEEEWKWLGKIRRMSRGRPVVLIADNIHWWDNASFGLLRKLSEARDWSEDSFLAGLKLIVVRTTDPSQADYLRKDFDQWFERVQPKKVKLHKCDFDQFSKAITHFGADQKIDKRTLEDLYALSGGNLKLAKLVSASLIDGSKAEEIAEEAASLGLLRALLYERFKERHGRVEEVLSTLKSAALIGVFFYRAEVTCLVSKSEDKDDIKERLENARATGLIEIDGDKYTFSHPVILDFVQNEVSPSEVGVLSEKLAHCLRLLRPADYRRQIDLFVAAGNGREAAQSAALHLIQQYRQHEHIPEETAREHQRLLEEYDVSEFCQVIEHGYEQIAEGSHSSALAALEALGDPLLPGLFLELTYIRSLCRMESGRREDAASVAEQLERHLEVEEVDDFLEIATRLRLLRQQALVLAGTVKIARTNSVSLMSILRKRAAVDHDAAKKYHQLLRKSNTIHDPFVARAHLLQAKTYFEPERPNELPEHPLEYYRTLVNLSGVEIQLGHWEEACIAVEEAFGLISANPVFRFPRLDVALNNLNVARLRHQLDPIKKSVEQQLLVVVHNQALNDNFQHRSNLAGMHLLAGSFAEARNVMDELEQEFKTKLLSELYVTYHLQSRRQVLTYLERDFASCLVQQGVLVDLISKIDWPSQPALMRRQTMMGRLIEGGEVLSPDLFDTWFVDQDARGSGPSWPHFGRGVQFSELQFWSDS